jgi:hypothetical protein
VFKKRLIVGSDPDVLKLVKKKQLKVNPHVFEASNQVTLKDLNIKDDVSGHNVDDVALLHEVSISNDD